MSDPLTLKKECLVFIYPTFLQSDVKKIFLDLSLKIVTVMNIISTWKCSHFFMLVAE